MNVIGIRASPDNQHARNVEADAIKSYVQRLGFPNKGLEWATDLPSALERGGVVVARRFSDLFRRPSEVEPALMRAIANERRVFAEDLGECTALLPALRTLCSAFAPLETEIARLNARIQSQADVHEIVLREAVALAVRRVIEKQLGVLLEETMQEVTARVQANPTPEPERFGTQEDVDAIVANFRRAKAA